MSQRWFTSKGKRVLTGWDRPLQYHFLVIWPNASGDGAHLFSNLDRRFPGMTLTEIRSVLMEHELKIPTALFKDLRDDRFNDRGNLQVDYGEIR